MEEIQIRIKGQIDDSWSDWLGGLTVNPTAEGETVLTGLVRDQSALCGLLNRLSGMGFRLISVLSEIAPGRKGTEQMREGGVAHTQVPETQNAMPLIEG